MIRGIGLWAICLAAAWASGAQANDNGAWQNPFRLDAPGPAQLAPVGAPPGTPPPLPDFFSDLATAGFSLQNTLTDPTQGAAFGQSDTDGKSGLKAQFAATYRSQSFYGSRSYDPNDPYIVAALDGNIDTSSTKSRLNSPVNARLEIGKEFQSVTSVADPYHPDLPPIPTGIYDLGTRSGPVFETTEDDRIRNALFETHWSYVGFGRDGGFIQFGQYVPIGASNWNYLIYPQFGVQAGQNLHGLELTREFKSTRLRIIEEPVFSISYVTPDKNKYFGLSSIALNVDDSMTEEPLEGRRLKIGKVIETSPTSHNLLNANLIFSSGALSIGPTYSVGQSAPSYTQNHSFALTLKLRFGNGAGFLGTSSGSS